MELKDLTVCTTNQKQFLKEFSKIFEHRTDDHGGSWLASKNKFQGVSLDQTWFLRSRLSDLVTIRYDLGEKKEHELVDTSNFSVCTQQERILLDQLRENGLWWGSDQILQISKINDGAGSQLDQLDFKADLSLFAPHGVWGEDGKVETIEGT